MKLKSDVLHLQHELRTAKAEARAASKEHGLFQAIVSDLEPRIVPMRPLASQILRTGRRDQIQESLVVHLSDGHHNQIIKAHEVGNREEHNFWISCHRAEVYTDAIIKWTQQTLSNFRFPNVYILAYGDHTSGEIHGAIERSHFKNSFRDCLAIGQLHSLMYRDLAPYFENINILYLSGNHGRRTITKEYINPRNNWDYLVAEVARMHCRDLPNVHFSIPDAFSAIINIEGHDCSVQHGDDIPGGGGIPWYGLERHTLKLISSTPRHCPRPDHFFCGHFHNPANVGPIGRRVVINGPWVGTDPYSFNKFGGYTEPEQLIHGFNEKRGMTWRLPIQLRTPDEINGPKRYRIELANNEGIAQEFSN